MVEELRLVESSKIDAWVDDQIERMKLIPDILKSFVNAEHDTNIIHEWGICSKCLSLVITIYLY